MRRIAHLITFFVSVLACCQAIAQGVNDAKTIQGTWEITELLVGGIKIADKDIKGMRFLFAQDKLMILPPTADTGIVDKRTFTFKLDGTAKPAKVDLTSLDGENKGLVSPGIYEIKGDTLRWYQSDDPKSNARPKDFTSPPSPSYYLFTFKRAQ